MRKQLSLILAGGLTLLSGAVYAVTTTSNFTVQIIISAACTIISASNVTFPGQGVLTANVPNSGTPAIVVQCTNTTPYTIGLNAGTGAGATVANRKMTGPGAATINYSIYQDAGFTTVWGNTIGTDTQSITSNGTQNSWSVYARVPAQNTPAPGTYTDTITVSVTY
jgi:spore coat protein U-like protein